MIDSNKTIEIVFDAIDEYNELQSKEMILQKSHETILFGGKSELDSLGLVSLITIIEERLNDDFDVEISLADEKAMSQRQSPFKSVATLVDYINNILEE